MTDDQAQVTARPPHPRRALLVGFSVGAHAGSVSGLEVHTSVSVNGVVKDADDQTLASGTASVTSSAAEFGNGGNAAGSATWGVLKIGGSAGAIGFGSGASGGYAKWFDWWTLSTGNAADAGKLVTVHATVLLDGNLQHSVVADGPNAQLSTAGARGDITIQSGGGRVGTGYFLSGFETATDEPQPYPDSHEAKINNLDVPSIFRTYDVEIVMAVDEAQWVYAQLGGSAGATAWFGGTANAWFNLDKSLYWGGISSVTLDGVEIDG